MTAAAMSATFRDTIVLVTGASSGIGAALAIELARRGASVVLAARREAELDAVARACERAGGRALAVPTDVGDAEACRRLVARAVEAFGGVDIVINNAGLSMVARFEDVTDLSLYERLMRVNYLGAVYLTHAALPHLLARRGLVVAISSLAGKLGLPTRTGYSASKHALQGFCDSLRAELAGRGTDVLVVSPGVVDTDIRAAAMGADGQALGADPYRAQRARGASVEQVVAEIVRAIERRERDVIVPRRLSAVPLLNTLAPRLVARIVKRRLPGGRSGRSQ